MSFFDYLTVAISWPLLVPVVSALRPGGSAWCNPNHYQRETAAKVMSKVYLLVPAMVTSYLALLYVDTDSRHLFKDDLPRCTVASIISLYLSLVARYEYVKSKWANNKICECINIVQMPIQQDDDEEEDEPEYEKYTGTNFRIACNYNSSTYYLLWRNSIQIGPFFPTAEDAHRAAIILDSMPPSELLMSEYDKTIGVLLNE